jgi:hypothetical protein
MDEDAKVHWAENVDKPRYRQFTIWGTLGSLVERKKSLYEPAFYLLTLLLADRQVWIIGKTWEIWAWNVLDID